MVMGPATGQLRGFRDNPNKPKMPLPHLLVGFPIRHAPHCSYCLSILAIPCESLTKLFTNGLLGKSSERTRSNPKPTAVAARNLHAPRARRGPRARTFNSCRPTCTCAEGPFPSIARRAKGWKTHQTAYERRRGPYRGTRERPAPAASASHISLDGTGIPLMWWWATRSTA